jgi:hypothetical protein
MQVQDIINNASTDFRQVLSNASPDSSLFISWCDRIQKDALHTSIYNYLITTTGQVSVVSGTSSYTIPVTNGAIRKVSLVYDRTFDRVIIPLEGIVYPTSLSGNDSPRQALQLPVEMVNAETMAQYPKYFKLEGTNTLVLFPAPQKTAFNGTYEVHYESQVPDLTATTSTFLLPDDSEDMVTAGVNSYVAQFLHLDTEAQFWSQQYEAYKKGMANA